MMNSRNIVDLEDEEVEEVWGIVSLDGEARNRSSGALILSGDEASSFNENNAGNPTANDDISIPGTDSIPSEIDTLDIITSGLHNVDAKDDGNETWRPDNEEQSSVARASTRSHLKIRAAIFFSVLFLITLVGCLAWENHSRGIALMRVREDKLRLEKEASLLKEKYPYLLFREALEDEAFKDMEDAFSQTFAAVPTRGNDAAAPRPPNENWIMWLLRQCGVHVQMTSYGSTTEDGGFAATWYSSIPHQTTYTDKQSRTFIDSQGRRVTVQSMEKDGNRIEDKYIDQTLVERKVRAPSSEIVLYSMPSYCTTDEK